MATKLAATAARTVVDRRRSALASARKARIGSAGSACPPGPRRPCSRGRGWPRPSRGRGRQAYAAWHWASGRQSRGAPARPPRGRTPALCGGAGVRHLRFVHPNPDAVHVIGSRRRVVDAVGSPGTRGCLTVAGSRCQEGEKALGGGAPPGEHATCASGTRPTYSSASAHARHSPPRLPTGLRASGGRRPG